MFHHFITIRSYTTSYKKTSVDTYTKEFDIIPKNKNNKEISLNIKKMNYIACFYDEFWWVQIAEGISELDIKGQVHASYWTS